MKRYITPFIFIILSCFICFSSEAAVEPGVERLFYSPYDNILKDKKIGLITNHTAIDSKGKSTIDLLKENAQKYRYQLKALFAPEHGLLGLQYAEEKVNNSYDKDGIPVYSLHGSTRRPTKEMLKGLDLLVFDIQDLGSRSYTYSSTLFYAMEEAAKLGIAVVVLDRPNPLGGNLIDGPMLEDKWRSFVGYINVPYCHGMTIGELAMFFNETYQVGCKLTVVPMRGWNRSMIFSETGLMWVPTSPHIPEAESAFFYPTTGLLGELGLVNIGVGYTLPFKVIGAPWIDADHFAKQLNAQQLPGIHFLPFHYRPFFGRFSGADCHGVLLQIRDLHIFQPLTTQYVLIGTLKSLYPQAFQEALLLAAHRIDMFNKVNGTAAIYHIIKDQPYPSWKLRDFNAKQHAQFSSIREPYLIKDYAIEN